MDKMSKSKKRFYIALFVGMFSIFTLTYTARTFKNASDKLININKAKDSLEDIDNPVSSNYAINKSKDSVNKELVKNTSKPNIKKYNKEKGVTEEEEKKVKETIATGNKVNDLPKLTFNEEKGLNWPIEGDIVKNYSMDKLVYYPTLGVFKVNPALFISAKEGSDVKAAHGGVVKRIGEDKEIGKFIETQIGNDYIVTYGQLKDVMVTEGENIVEGSIIAKVDRPTSYYTKEGAHVYFKVEQGNIAVDPMLLLR